MNLAMLIVMGLAYTGSGTEGTVNAGAKTIEQFGVTWTFDKTPVSADPNYAINYLYGQYANGDYWIYDEDGSVTITAISPARTQVVQNGVTYYMDGSQIDPSDLDPGPQPTGTKQGFDQRGYRWDASVSVVAPLTLTGLHSLITAKSFRIDDVADEITTIPPLYTGSVYQDPTLRYAAVLTTVAAIPASGAFRPAFCGTTSKVTTHNVSDLDTYIAAHPFPTLAKKGTIGTSYADETHWIETLRRPCIGNFITSWSGGQLHPSENSGGVFGAHRKGYGQDYAVRLSNIMLLLMLDTDTISAAQKRTLAIQLIQHGIDCYGVVVEGGGWGHIGGGWGQGRKLPILFAGVCLDDTDMKAVQTNYGENEDMALNLLYFMEDTQKFYITDADVTRWGVSSRVATRTNCSVSAGDPKTITDDDGGNWLTADGGGNMLYQAGGTVNQDYWLVWNYGTAAPEYVRIRGTNYLGAGTDTMRLRHPVTPGTGKTARVQLFPAGRLGYPDWSGGTEENHWEDPDIADYQRRSYRWANTANSLVAHELFALAIPTLDGKGTIKSLWNYQEFFDYMDHYMIFAKDADGFIAGNRAVETWHASMWDEYRTDYGDVWVEPTIGLIGDKNCIEGETVSFTVQDNDGYGTGTTDINGDSLSFSIDATSEGKGMTINASTGAFEWVTEEGDAGTHNVYFTVENDAGRKVYQGITITVEDGTLPTPAVDPVLAPVGNQSFLLSQAVEIDVVDATDENGGTLTYSASGLPSGMTINSSTGAFDGTPTSPGRFPVRIIVTDDTSRTDYEDIVIEIHNGTHPASFLKGS